MLFPLPCLGFCQLAALFDCYGLVKEAEFGYSGRVFQLGFSGGQGRCKYREQPYVTWIQIHIANGDADGNMALTAHVIVDQT